MRTATRHILILLLLITVGFTAYFHGLADTPHRDDASYMLERAFVQTDGEWLMHSLSLPRTRALRHGDTFLFRPLHMAVLAAKDILLRNNLFASGALNILFLSLAGFSLYLFSDRLLGRTVATAIAVLFMLQHAGIEMAVWGHINPYLMALACFGFGLTAIMNATPQKQELLLLAGVFFLVGALFHELIILALVLTAPVLLYAQLRAGRRAEEGSIPIKRYVVWTVAFPVAAYLALDLADFFYRGAPMSFDPPYHGMEKLPSAVLAAPGAAAVAFIAPFAVKLSVKAGAFVWDFSEMMSPVVVVGAVTTVALLGGICRSTAALRRRPGSALALVTLISLLMFLGFIIGVGYGRLYTRDVFYMYVSTYYYSVTGYIFCLLLALGLRGLSAASGDSKVITIARRGALGLMVALIAINGVMTVKTLRHNGPNRFEPAMLQSQMGKALESKKAEYCLSSFLSEGSNKFQSMLLREYACRDGDTRKPVNISPGPGRSLWFVEVVNPPMRGGAPVELIQTEASERDFGVLENSISLRGLSDEKELLLSKNSYDAPDISMTLRHGLNAAVVLGYRGDGDYIAFRVDGPLVYGRVSKGGELGPVTNENALPRVKAEYRLEVRHSGPLVYFFVDGRLVGFLPASPEREGKVGVFLQNSVEGETAVGDVVVAPSGGVNAPSATPFEIIADGK